MRAVIQRVTSAQVVVDGEVTGRCVPPLGEHGLLVLLGVTHGDSGVQATTLADKIWGLRILTGERSAEQVGAPILVVSQFTLYADTRRGRRPSWSAAAGRGEAEPLVDAFCDALRHRGAAVETGAFGEEMQVSLTNDGPVTIVLDTADLAAPRG